MKLGLGLLLAVAGLHCNSDVCSLPPEAPCAQTVVADFVSKCGFESFTTTCDPDVTCNGSACSIAVSNAQTCDGAIVLGDGTSHSLHLEATETAPSDAGTCPMMCPPAPKLHLTLDGADAGTRFAVFSSATCAAPDGGMDGE